MNNDLISRETLKKAITEATYNFEQIPIRVDKVQEIIDNAPTVIATEDCISREGAINALSHDRVCCNVCRKALETILPVELTERPQGEWIPVSERLPEENGDYIVTFFLSGKEETAKSWYNTRYGFSFDNVIAWMPMPEPYKKGGAEE